MSALCLHVSSQQRHQVEFSLPPKGANVPLVSVGINLGLYETAHLPLP